MTTSKVNHFRLWLIDREKNYSSIEQRKQRILKQEFYYLEK